MTISDYPFASKLLYAFDMVFIDNISSYVVIGGHDNLNYLSQIGMLTNGTWSDAGQLNSVRAVSFRLFFIVSTLLNQF